MKRQDLSPLTEIYQLRQLVNKLSNVIFSIHGHDRLKLFDTVLALLLVKIYDELMNPNHLNFPELLGQDDSGLIGSFQSLFKWAIYHFNLSLIDLQPSIGPEALHSSVKLLAPFSLLPTAEGQIEILGTFYQEIVSSTFRGSLGAYLTPKPIVDLAVNICQPSIDDVILDKCCGTGTFLLGSRDFAIKNAMPHAFKRETLVFGCDIQGRMCLATILNSFFHGILQPAIIQGNALELDLNEWHSFDSRVPCEGFSLIVGNPPFAGFESAKYLPYSLKQTRINKVIPFIAKTVELLRPGGRAALVIPISVLNAEARPFAELREWLASKAVITEIIGLPKDAFVHTDTGVEGALLFFKQKSEGFPQGYTFFKTLTNIGYDRRGRFVSGSDVKESLRLWRRQNLANECWIEARRIQELDRWDPAWLREHHNSNTLVDKTDHIPLTDLCIVGRQQLKEKDIQPNHIYRYFEVKDADINSGKVLHIHKIEGRKLVHKIRVRVPVKEGDVLLPNHRDSLIAKTARKCGRSAILITNNEDGCITTNRLTVLRPLIDAKLFVFILNTPAIRNQLVFHARGSASLDIREKILKNIWIPKRILEDDSLKTEILTTIQAGERLEEHLDKVNSHLELLSRNFN